MILELPKLKMGLRRFLERHSSDPVALTWDADSSYLNIESNGHGMDAHFRPETLNAEGDYMTDEEKQDIVDALSAIVDEHNAQVGN
tara:strand:- start:163 stop:420 length:258 start_codon:yes stop_codon:yes gene_type:complete